MYEELIANVNWIAVIVGAIVAFAAGSLWYSKKMFGTRWAKDQGITEGGGMVKSMIVQGVATFLLAWVIGITETTNAIWTAVLIALMAAALIKSNGMWSMKTKYVIGVESGYVIVMVALMILTHAVL